MEKRKEELNQVEVEEGEKMMDDEIKCVKSDWNASFENGTLSRKVSLFVIYGQLNRNSFHVFFISSVELNTSNHVVKLFLCRYEKLFIPSLLKCHCQLDFFHENKIKHIRPFQNSTSHLIKQN